MELAHAIRLDGGAGAVVDHDPPGGMGNGGEAGLDGPLATGAATDEAGGQVGTDLLGDLLERLLLGSGPTDDDDAGDDPGAEAGGEDMGEGRLAVEGEEELVVGGGGHAGTAAAGEQESDGIHGG